LRPSEYFETEEGQAYLHDKRKRERVYAWVEPEPRSKKAFRSRATAEDKRAFQAEAVKWMGLLDVTRAVCEDIMNFVFATASARESMRNLLSRKADLLPQTALARHRTIGGHAGGPRMALRQRQFLGH
jgi:hypothetical protein